jgi:hypothetical protein
VLRPGLGRCLYLSFSASALNVAGASDDEWERAPARAPDDPTPAFAPLSRGPQVGPSVGGAAGVRALLGLRVSLLFQAERVPEELPPLVAAA